MYLDKILIFILFLIFKLCNAADNQFYVFEGDGSTTSFNGYPSSTNSVSCLFSIPFMVVSNYEIKSVQIYLPPTSTLASSSILMTSISSDSKQYIGTLSTNSSIGLSLLSINITTLDNVSDLRELKFNCQAFDLNSISLQVLNQGIYYNRLAFIIKFNKLPVENVTLDIYSMVPPVQSYLGDNTYFITFKKNFPMFFIDTSLNLCFQNNQQYIGIKFNSLKKFNGIPKLTFYPPVGTTTTFTYSLFVEISEIKQLDSAFFVTGMEDGLYSDEPYLIGSRDNSNFTFLGPIATNPLSNLSYSIGYYNDSTFRSDVNQFYQQNSPNIKPISSFVYNFGGYYTYTRGFTYPEQPELYSFNQPNSIYKFPFGFKSKGNGASAQIEIGEYLETIRYAEESIKFYIFDEYQHTIKVPVTNAITITNDMYPVLTNYELKLLAKGRMVLSLNTYCDTGNLNSITIYQTESKIYKTYSLSQVSTFLKAPNSKDQVIEIQLETRFTIYKIVLKTSTQITNEYLIGSNYKYLINNKIQSLYNIQDLDKLPSNFNYSSALKSLYFLFNDLNVTNSSISNKMTLRLENYPTDREIKVSFIYSDYYANERKDSVYSTLNQNTQQYDFEFNIPANIKPGSVNYIITLDSLEKLNYFSFALPYEYQLRVAESKNIDLFGSIITSISGMNNFGGYIQWDFSIESINGFSSGIISVRGSIDLSVRNFTIDSTIRSNGGSIYNGDYSIGLAISPSLCSPQSYSISYVYLQDTQGYFTEYEAGKINKKNPFFRLVDSIGTSLVVDNYCVPDDSIEMEASLVTFSVSTNSDFKFSALKDSRTLTFNYLLYHGSGFDMSLSPVVYAISTNFRMVASYNTEYISGNLTFSNYSSTIEIPYLFIRDGESIVYSIFGVVSKVATVSGFTCFHSNSPSLDISLPSITGSSSLSSTGLDGVWLYGSLFDLAKEFKIKYHGDSEYKTIGSSKKSSTSVYLSGIKATSKPITVNAINYNNQLTEPFTIYPIAFDLESDQGTPTNDSSLCKGSPLCGGSSQGVCYSTGCKCISPWIGLDCMSQVIKVPPPTINETNPSTNITLGQDISTTSIISIVGIIERGIDGNEVNKYIFSEWEYRLISNDSFTTRYSYSSVIKKDDKVVSNITATLDWYKKESIVYFADQEVSLNPSTIKYTIKITSYPFTTQLNTLQLIMKASIHSDNSSSCTDKQFGQINQDDSDYIKLQVENLSFYGRFIKRCIIDNDQITTLTNTLLDATMNSEIINDHQTSQSYIGINIAQFQDNVVIDPDFSVILDPSFAKGICKSSSSGLTVSQIAGIIVGSICLFIVLLIILSFIIYKSNHCIPVKIFFYKIFKKSKV